MQKRPQQVQSEVCMNTSGEEFPSFLACFFSLSPRSVNMFVGLLFFWNSSHLHNSFEGLCFFPCGLVLQLPCRFVLSRQSGLYKLLLFIFLSNYSLKEYATSPWDARCRMNPRTTLFNNKYKIKNKLRLNLWCSLRLSPGVSSPESSHEDGSFRFSLLPTFFLSLPEIVLVSMACLPLPRTAFICQDSS